MLGCNLQWIQRGCRLDQQELAVSRLGLQAVYCPNSACTSAYRDIKILVLTDCIRGLHCVTHVWYVHSMYYMYIYICLTDYIRAVSENFNALRKRTSTCIYGYLLRRARHSSMCPTCDQDSMSTSSIPSISLCCPCSNANKRTGMPTGQLTATSSTFTA